MYTDIFLSKLKVLCVLILFFIITDSFGAPRIQIQKNSIDAVSELWNLQIISDFSSSKIINLKVAAYNSSNILLYEASTDNFVLQPGISSFNSNQQQLVRVKYSNEQLLSMLGNGELTVIVSMSTPGSYAELSQTRQVININGVQRQDEPDTSVVRKFGNIDIGGTVELTGLYNTREDTLFYMPFDYFRLQTHHQVNVQGLPFIYDMYVTTEQKYTNQRLNSYRFRFDYETFKEQLIGKVRQRIETVEQLGDVTQLINEKDRLTKASVLDSLKNNKLIKDEYIDRYKEYISIDSMKNYLGVYDEAELKKTITELEKYRQGDSLRNKVNMLSAHKIADNLQDSLRNKINAGQVYDSIALSAQNKHDNLSGKISNNNVPDSIRNKLNESTLLYDSVAHSVQNKYDLLLSKYNNNKDSLDRFLEKMNRYKVQDLISFSKLNNVMNDKIASYEKYYNKKEIEKLKQLSGSDITELEGQLNSVSDKYKILERKEQLLNSLKRFEMGTVYPYYSNYTVNGVVLNGYNINYTYKNIYTSFSGGKQLNIINDSINNFVELKRPVLFAFALGYGDKFDSHIHLNYSYGSRKFHNKVSERDFKTVNHVIAPDFAYRFFKEKWIISGEFPVSFTSRQVSDSDSENKIGFANEVMISGTVTPSTAIEIGNKYFSEYFHTYGVPFLFSNYLNSHQKIKQKIKESITAEVGYNYEKFMRSKQADRVPTDIHTLQSAVNIGYKKWNINVMYAPVWLWIKDETNTSNFMHTSGIALSSAYMLKGNKQLISSIGFNYNSFYNAQTYVSDYGSLLIKNNVFDINKSLNIYISERLVVKNDYIIGFNISLQKNNFIDENNIKLIILGVNYTQNIKNVITYTVTYQAMKDIGNSFRHSSQCQLNYQMNRYLGVGAVLYYDHLNGTVEGRRHSNTNAFQVMTNLIFKI